MIIRQEAHGTHHSPEKHFKSMNTFERSYDYIHYKVGPVVQEEEIFEFRECIFAILLIPLYVKRWLPSLLKKLLFPFTPGWFFPSFDENCTIVPK